MLIQLIKRTTFLIALFALLAPVFAPGARANAQPTDNPSETSAQYAMDWRSTGPSGGDVRALVFDPQDAQRLYFGTLDGQIYTSINGGATWRLLYNFNRPKLFLDNIIVDPRDSKVIYVAAHRHKDPGGFFKTTDGGVTWRESQELKAEAIHSLEQSSANPNILIVGTNNRVFKSTDSGDTWSPVTPFGTTAIESLAIDPRDSNTIYAGTWYLPYKSTDGGQNWKSIKSGMIDDSDVFAIDIDPRNPNHIIASACSGIYDSKNSGESWRKIQGIPSQSRRTRAILQHPSIAGVVFAGTTEGFWRSSNGGADGSWQLTTRRDLEINSIAVHPSNPQTIFIATNNYGVMVSRDAGKSFVPSNEGYSTRFTNVIVPDRERPERVYAATINTATGGGFIFISNNGGLSWEPAIRNITVNRLTVYSILQDVRDANIIYLGTNYGIYRSTDRGGSWSPIGAPKTGPANKPATGRRGRGRAAAPRSGAASSTSRDVTKRAQEALIAAGYDPGPADGAAGTQTVTAIRKFQADKNIPVSGKLDDATLSALGLSGGVQTTTPAGKMPTPVVALTEAVNTLSHTYDEQNGRPGLFAATNAGLYRTYDPMQGWEKISYGPGVDPRTTAVSVSAQNPKTIYVGTANSGVLVSRDGGETWKQVSGVPAQAPISSIEQDPKRSAYVYVGTKQSLYVSHDGGERWMRRGGNLPYGDYASILINPDATDEIIVGNAWENGGGVYRSTDAGISWNRIDPRAPGLPSQRIWALAFDPKNQDKIFVGSHSAGIYLAERNGAAAASSVR
ncbi:MAG TPA: YCF48-related protein [Pyrinomonadaceae bacterium]|nr:YCF48-related protein [Pyrinomonadaceae bacterium]